MGMFDSVFATCPNCSFRIEIQSKAGVCELKKYHESRVPIVVALDLEDTTVTCKNCKQEFKVVVGPKPDRVPISLDFVETDEEWD